MHGIAIAYQPLLFAKVTIISMASNKKSENKPLKVLFLPVSTIITICTGEIMKGARAGIRIVDARFRRPAAIATRAMPRHAVTMWHCARHEP